MIAIYARNKKEANALKHFTKKLTKIQVTNSFLRDKEIHTKTWSATGHISIINYRSTKNKPAGVVQEGH